MKVTLKAKTAEGFGGKDFYEEKLICENDTDIKAAMVAFAISYGVSLDMIEITIS